MATEGEYLGLNNQRLIGAPEDSVDQLVLDILMSTAFTHDVISMTSEERAKKLKEILKPYKHSEDLQSGQILLLMNVIHILVVEFSKLLPIFLEASQDNQIIFLLNGGRDMAILSMARRCDVETNSIILIDDQKYSRKQFMTAGLGDVFDDLLELSLFMHRMKVDALEFVFLGVISLSSVNPLMELRKSDERRTLALQRFLALNTTSMRVFKDYVLTNYGQKEPQRIENLLSILPKLRLLSSMFYQLFSDLKRKRQILPGLLAEIWSEP